MSQLTLEVKTKIDSGLIDSRKQVSPMFCVWGGRSGRVPRVEEGRGLPGLDEHRRATESPVGVRRARWPLTDDARRHPGGADDTNTKHW